MSILITGTGSGLGRSTLDYCTERGDHVFACVEKENELEKLKDLKNVTPIKLDVTVQGDIDAAVKFIKESGKQLDGLVNNAGIALGGPIAELPDEFMERTLNVNVMGPFRMTKAFFPLLLPTKGRIVNISSVSGFRAFPYVSPYTMSKHAIEAFSDSLRRELDPLGMKVVIIEPGDVKTPIWQKGLEMLDQRLSTITPLFRDRANALLRASFIDAATNGLEPVTIAKAVYKALHVAKPKIRYYIDRSILRKFLFKRLTNGQWDAVIRMLAKGAMKKKN